MHSVNSPSIFIHYIFVGKKIAQHNKYFTIIQLFVILSNIGGNANDVINVQNVADEAPIFSPSAL